MRMRRTARHVGLVITAVFSVWTSSLLFGGGFAFQAFGHRISSNEPLRPLTLAAVGLWIWIWGHGTDRAWSAWGRATSRISDAWVVAALSLTTFVAGVAYNTTVGVGSDSYGYISEADLWLRHDLKVPQPWAAAVPWPAAGATFAPLGYRPVGSVGNVVNVPSYSPGLPLLMATAKAIAGQAAMFVVVPLFGALMVLTTWGIGVRLGSSRLGLAAAWLVATSAAFLHMLMLPMSDVVSAALLTIAFYLLMGPPVAAATFAGIASAMAIVTRPNLVYVPAIFAFWILLRPGDTAGRRARRVLAFGVPVAVSALGIAAFYRYLYGSATTSGYGSAGSNFQPENLVTNLGLYVTWLIRTQTPLALAGIGAILIPLRRLWPSVRDRSALWAAAALVVALWFQYCAYLVFDHWLFLRFLLPSWPFMMLGLAACAGAAASAGGAPGLKLAMAGLVIGLGVRDLRSAAINGVFNVWRDDRRFVAAANLVRARTDDRSIVFSMLHSGSLRYYGGRMSLRYDQLDPAWLDRSVEWFQARGIHSYALLEDSEVEVFRKQFAGQATVRRLDTPLATYSDVAPGTTTKPVTGLFFDLSADSPSSSAPGAMMTVDLQHEPPRVRAQAPAPEPRLPLMDR